MQRLWFGEQRGFTIARALCFTYGLMATLLAIGFYRGSDWATNVWPWPDNHITFIYLSSLAAAIAIAFLWAGWSGDMAVVNLAALNSVFANGGIALYLLAIGIRREDGDLIGFGIGSFFLTAVFAVVFQTTRRFPAADPRPTPPPFRFLIGMLAAIVLLVAAGLLFQVSWVFPYEPRPETSTLFGCIYVGVTVYFAYGALAPAWSMSTGQLLGLVAYGAVLAKPFSDLLFNSDDNGSGIYGGQTGPDTNDSSLTVFMIVVAAGALVALWAFLINPGTRLVAFDRDAESSPVEQPAG